MVGPESGARDQSFHIHTAITALSISSFFQASAQPDLGGPIISVPDPRPSGSSSSPGCRDISCVPGPGTSTCL